MDVSRRGVLRALIAAPIIVAVGSIMPVKALSDGSVTFDGTTDFLRPMTSAEIDRRYAEWCRETERRIREVFRVHGVLLQPSLRIAA